VFYQVAFNEQVKKSSGCYPDSTVPADVKSDKTTFHKSGLFLLYGVVEEGEDKLYLDTGETALEGVLDVDVYVFTATSTDVDYTEDAGGGDKHTTTNKVTVEMTIDGTEVAGKVVGSLKTSCSGATCDLTMPTPSSCTTTQTFLGTEVEDVEFHHDI
jgi:hypothetical protein